MFFTPPHLSDLICKIVRPISRKKSPPQAKKFWGPFFQKIGRMILQIGSDKWGGVKNILYPPFDDVCLYPCVVTVISWNAWNKIIERGYGDFENGDRIQQVKLESIFPLWLTELPVSSGRLICEHIKTCMQNNPLSFTFWAKKQFVSPIFWKP